MRLLKAIADLVMLIREIIDKKVTVYAAQAAFFLILSVIPFLMTALNVMQIYASDLVKLLFDYAEGIASAELRNVCLYVLNELRNQSNGVLFSFTALGAVWSSSKGVMSIERGLNVIYKNPRGNGFFRIRILSFIYMILFYVILGFMGIFLMFGSTIHTLLVKYLPALAMVFDILLRYRLITAIPLLVFIFMIIYTFYPGRRVRFIDQFPGALFSAICWVIFSLGYEYYMVHVTDYSKIYGSLGAILFVALFIYFGICIVMLGAEVNFFLKHK